MNGENTNALVGQLAADDIIKSRIFTIRGVQVMLDTGALSSDKIRQESVALIAAANRGALSMWRRSLVRDTLYEPAKVKYGWFRESRSITRSICQFSREHKGFGSHKLHKDPTLR